MKSACYNYAYNLFLKFHGCFSAIFLMGLCNLPGWTAPSSDSLNISIDEFRATERLEFYSLCRLLNRPCGEEIVFAQQGEGSTELNLKNTTPRKILGEIARLYPGHHWIVRDDVLNFEPEKKNDEDVLARKLSYLSIQGKSSNRAAHMVFAQAQISVGEIVIGPSLYYSRIDLELRNVTVREALNAIAKADGQVLWSFTRKGSDNPMGIFLLNSWRKSGISEKDEILEESSTMRKWMYYLSKKLFALGTKLGVR